MKEIKIKDLENDLFEGYYISVPVRLKIKDIPEFDTQIEFYTHDEFPFKNYIIVKDYGKQIPFDEIEKIEVLD